MNRYVRRTAALAAAFATLTVSAFLTAGCGGSASQARATWQDPNPLPPDTMTVPVPEIGTYGGRFVIGQTNPPKTFNGIMANETSSTDIVDQLFTKLVGFDNARQVLYPLLAKSWEMSPDARTWTFHLRRGARFSDGAPITAADVLFSFQIAYDPVLHPSIQDVLVSNGKPFEVTAPDSYTVAVTAAAPFAIMPTVLSSLRIMPRHRLQAAYDAGTYASAYGVNTAPESLVTSHAWRIKQYLPGEKTVLERNPYWFGVDPQGQRLPYLDELVYVIVPDQNTASLQFQSGNLDAVDNVKPEDYTTYDDGQERGNYTVHDLGPAMNTNFMWFNLNIVREAKTGKRVGAPQVDPKKYAWFANREFRRAVSKAIDREAMIRGPYFGEAVKNWSQSTAGSQEWYSPDIVKFDHDPEGAKQILAGLGFKDGDGDGTLEDRDGNPISFTLKTNGDNAIRVALMNLIRDDLAQVGIRVIPTPTDFNTLITNFRQDFQYEAALLGLQSGVPPDPGQGGNVWRSSGLTHYWNVKQPRPETPAEARIDALMDSLVSNPVDERRKAIWKEVQNIVNEECWIVWLPTLEAKIPIRNKFGNLQPSVMAHRILWNVDRIFVKSRSPRA
jgi:peptide/nickel transport system substrate-binding protein